MLRKMLIRNPAFLRDVLSDYFKFELKVQNGGLQMQCSGLTQLLFPGYTGPCPLGPGKGWGVLPSTGPGGMHVNVRPGRRAA